MNVTAICNLIVILGISGDLARKKIMPSLWNLYAQDLLPPHSYIIGFARSDLSVDSLRAKVTPHVTLKSDQDREKYDRFWADGHVSYVRAKSTASIEEYRKLERSLAAIQRGGIGSSKLNKSSGNSASNDPPTFVACHRVFYFALPPHVYAEVATAVRNVSMAKGGHGATTKIVLEKPFGSDLASSNLLSSQLSALFTEQQLYRMDHYLGKEMVQNLLPFRFANAVFEPLWNRRHVDAVELLFKESFGTYGRGGYFDAAGIIRDVVQNHLLQALTLLAMEEPASLSAEDVRNRKVELLKAMRTLTPEDTVLGQYAGNPAAAAHEDAHLGYTDDPGVSNASKAATYSLTVLHIDNDRWRGVPFVIRAGKALDANQVEARVYFRPPPNLLYSRNDHGEDPQNVLILRIQPNEAIVQRVRVRRPGLEKVEDLVESTLDLTYSDKFKNADIIDAYDRLLLDIFSGRQVNFVRTDELQEAWRVFTPVLHLTDNGSLPVHRYPFGASSLPQGDALLAAKYSLIALI